MLLVLSLVPVLKQQFNELRDGERQANRDKKFSLFFLQRKINIEEFNSNLLKIDKSYKDTDIQYIRYIAIKKNGDCENMYSVNPLYLIIDKVGGYIEEKNGNKYLVFDSTELHSTDENKEVLKKYSELWDGIKIEMKTISNGKKR